MKTEAEVLQAIVDKLATLSNERYFSDEGRLLNEAALAIAGLIAWKEAKINYGRGSDNSKKIVDKFGR